MLPSINLPRAYGHAIGTCEEVADGQPQQLAPLVRRQLPPVVLHAREPLLWGPLRAAVAAGPPAAASRATLLPLRRSCLLRTNTAARVEVWSMNMQQRS